MDVSLAGSAFLPDSYIPDPGQKLHLYRRLSRLENHEEVDALREELKDRFGSISPTKVARLLDAQDPADPWAGSWVLKGSPSRSGTARHQLPAPGGGPGMSALDRPFREPPGLNWRSGA